MSKIQSSFAEPIQERRVTDFRLSIHRFFELFQKKLEMILFKRGLILFLCGLLLGRAFILSSLSPFSLPFLQLHL